ncbi:MAG: rod shape-determining protein MreC [Eubacterium sp.]|nr:rod shape-determining protein MreC [Eubacterium sp.]
MRDFFSGFKFKIIICVFALVFGVVIYAAVSGGVATLPETILTEISKPFIAASNAISSWVEDTLDRIVNADKYKEQVDQLTEQLNAQYQQLIDFEKIKNENDQLREALKIKEENEDFEFSPPCNIISRSQNDINGGFMIDRGSNDGIALYDPVMTSNGLVGMVSEIGLDYARVTTILSSDLNLGVMTFESKVIGIIENDAEHADNGECLMSYVSKDSGIKEGEIVKSSAGVVFPGDILIGTVKEVYDDENGLSVHAVIEPAVNILAITDCVVITNFKGQGVVD